MAYRRGFAPITGFRSPRVRYRDSVRFRFGGCGWESKWNVSNRDSQQNGRHERMHRTLKGEVLPGVSRNLLEQQEQLDRFREDFNQRRPHEALKMRCPADLYKPSLKRYPPRLPEPLYSHHDLVRVVYDTGSVHFRGLNKFFLSHALAGQTVGFEEEQDGMWRISFMDLDLGFLDEQTMKFNPISPEDSDQRLSLPSRERR